MNLQTVKRKNQKIEPPRDGLSSVSINAATNRVNTSDWEYDLAGNLIRGKDGTAWQKFEFDAAGRLVTIKNDSDTVLETYTYGASREKLKVETSSQKTYFAWGGQNVISEYTEATASSTPGYVKSYVYAGSRLLVTYAPTSTTKEAKQYHHPDRLGTQLVTTGASTSFRQTTFPFGTTISAETTGNTNQVFISYDRSGTTGLDYAQNRTYSQAQSRFTQVDPIQMASASLGNPQSNNLYAYVQNMPTDFVDPSGLLAVRIVCYRIGYMADMPGFPSVYRCISFGGGSPNTGGVDNTGINTGGGGGGEPPAPKGCPVAPLSEITDPEAQSMENGNRVVLDKFNAGTVRSLQCLQDKVMANPMRLVFGVGYGESYNGKGYTMESGYRPESYQSHLYEIYKKSQQLKKYGKECNAVRNQVEAERDDHKLNGLVAPSNSRHSSGDGFDMKITGHSNSQITRMASQCGLKRLVGVKGEETHFYR